MSRIRFVTVRDLFEVYPAAIEELDIEPSDEPSLAFLHSLVTEDTVDKAIGFCAYLLPRRESVWWGCQSVRLLLPERSGDQSVGLRAAEDWVAEPEENRRQTAFEFGMQADRRWPTTWLALAAGWAGGGGPLHAPAPPAISLYQTARSVRAAILIGACRCQPSQSKPRLLRCAQGGTRFASGEDLRM